MATLAKALGKFLKHCSCLIESGHFGVISLVSNFIELAYLNVPTVCLPSLNLHTQIQFLPSIESDPEELFAASSTGTPVIIVAH